MSKLKAKQRKMKRSNGMGQAVMDTPAKALTVDHHQRDAIAARHKAQSRQANKPLIVRRNAG